MPAEADAGRRRGSQNRRVAVRENFESVPSSATKSTSSSAVNRSVVKRMDIVP